MNKPFWSVLTLGLCLVVATPSFVYAKDKKEDKKEIAINLDDVLGVPNNHYVGENDYKKANHDYYEVRLLSDYEAGLTKGFWKSSNVTEVTQELNAFKTASGSPAIRELWRTAMIDDFKGIGGNNTKKDIDLAVARVNTLIKLGLFHDAIRLYHAMNQKPIPDALAAKAIDAMALAGMSDAACLEVKFVAQSVRTTPWLKKRALCAAHHGEKDVTKHLNAYLKDSIKEDTIHQSVARLLTRPSVNGPIKTSLSPLQRALLLSHGGTFSTEALNKADGVLTASVAMSPYMSFEKRLKAANKAVVMGVIGPKELLATYEKIPLSDAQISQARDRLFNGADVSGATALAIIMNTHDPEPRARAIQKFIAQKNYRTNVTNQLWIRFADKISSQADEVPFFAQTGYALSVWQDYLPASKAYFPLAKDDLSILEDVSDVTIPEDSEIDAVLAYIDKKHPKTAEIRKERVLAALKGSRLIEDVSVPEEMLKAWKDGKKTAHDKGTGFVEGLNQLSIEKPGLSDPKVIYQTLEKNSKNQFFEENRKITLEIIVQSVL